MPPDSWIWRFDAGRDAVQALFAAQAERIRVLEAEIEELKRLISRSSNNSSLPPSRLAHKRGSSGPTRSAPLVRSRAGSPAIRASIG